MENQLSGALVQLRVSRYTVSDKVVWIFWLEPLLPRTGCLFSPKTFSKKQ